MGFDPLAVMLAAGLMASSLAGADSSPCPSSSMNMNVTSTADVDTLTDLLNCTGQGVFNVTWYSSLTIAQTIEVSNTKDVSITGSGLPTICGGRTNDNDDLDDNVDPGSGTGIFSVSNGSTLRLGQLVLSEGDAESGGAVKLLRYSALFVSGCTFSNNSAASGGAIYASNSTIFIEGSTSFENNSALSGGTGLAMQHSAIYAYDSDVNINGTATFSHNSAKGDVSSNSWYSPYANPAPGYSGSGAISGSLSSVNSDKGPAYSGGDDVSSSSFYSSSFDTASGHLGGDASSRSEDSSYAGYSSASSGGDVASSSAYSSYSNDTSYFSGGAIFATDGSQVHIDGDSSFSNNLADDRGGAIFAKLSEVNINGSTLFAANWAGVQGGAVTVYSSKVYINASTTYIDNVADFGGAVHSRFSEVYMDGRNYFANNEAWNYGGAVYAKSSNIDMAGVTEFVNHSSGTFGGTLYADASEVRTEGTTSFCNGWTLYGGGAIYLPSSRIYLSGSTELTNNTAGNGVGGAIRADKSEVIISGNAVFSDNRASSDGEVCRPLSIKGQVRQTPTHLPYTCVGPLPAGAITGFSSNFSIMGIQPGYAGESYSTSGGNLALNQSVVFIQNYAGGLGGAMFIEDAGQFQVRGATFSSNEATLGGAGYILAVANEETEFTECVFDGNQAEDGGALYLYTGPGADNFATSVFRHNFASTSGGAIFHTGSMRVVNTTFLGNKAGVEGPAVMSVGLLQTLSNVSFLKNGFFCRAGEYGYTDNEETDTCSLCLDEVCSRCSTGGDDVRTVKDVRIDGFPLCAVPPSGATSPKTGTTVLTLTLNKGYYRTSSRSQAVRKCYEAEACVGGNDGNNYCAPGYKGPYCAVCSEGFAPGLGYSCRKCSKEVKRTATWLTVTTGLAALLMTALLFVHLGSLVHDAAWGDMLVAENDWRQKCWSCQADLVKMLPLTAIKTVATVWQIVSQLDTIAEGVYPPLYRKFVSKLGPINLDLDFIFSYSCLFKSDFYDHLLVATLSPFVVIVMLAGSYAVGRRRNRSSQAAKLAVLHKHQGVLLYMAFFAYSPVSYKIFQAFACDELDDGNSYLRADYSLRCSTSRHAWYKAYALVMVFVYPIGIAVAFACLLGRHRHDLIKPQREGMLHLKSFHGLWSAYKPSRYFYEVIECGRRIVLTSVAAFVLDNSAAQISIVLLFAVFFVFVSEAIGPFQKAADMNLYRWGNGIIVASMYVAFLSKIDVGYDTNHAMLTFSGVLIAANLFMVVTVLLQAVLLVKEWRSVRNEVKMADTPVRRSASLGVSDEEKC